MLSKEAGSHLQQWVLCDNIDLPTILQEYESYFFVKFKRLPKISKKRGGTCTSSGEKPPLLSKSSKGASCSLPSLSGPTYGEDYSASHSRGSNDKSKKQSSGSVKQRPSNDGRRKDKKKSLPTASPPDIPTLTSESLGLTGSSISEKKKDDHSVSSKVVNVRGILADTIKVASDDIQQDSPEVRLLKPFTGFAGYNSEMRDLAAVISRDIYSSNPGVRWDDIIGLDAAKRLVKEAVVYPIKYPQLFSGIMSPWKGLLLYGPPGTGKTMLAKAVATECNTTFFNISASTIVSKWRGDSEKLVRVLFELARFHAPSTIFMDELESIMGQRSGFGAPGGEHEGSRRMKTELLVQMDGLARSSHLVFVLAASNLPWELDHAMLRRLEKRILVDLPTEHARSAMFRHYLPPVVTPPPFSVTSDIDYEAVSKLTDGYTGSDIRLVCKEAAMKSVRLVFDQLESLSINQGSQDATSNQRIEIQPVRTDAVKDAIRNTKPSARTLANRYLDWQKEYASV